MLYTLPVDNISSFLRFLQALCMEASNEALVMRNAFGNTLVICSSPYICRRYFILDDCFECVSVVEYGWNWP